MGSRLRLWLSHPDVLRLLLLVTLTSAAYLPNLGSYAFWDPWEPHYAQVAKEMADHDTWMDPWYRGQDNWWSKPILPLWLLRASFAAFNISDPGDPWVHFAGRLPIFLMALAGILLTYGWVSRLYDRRAGLFAALVLLTTPMYALLAHQVMFDMPFVSMCAAALGYYILSRSENGRPAHVMVFYLLTALAFLSKWLLALFIPIGVVLAMTVIRMDLGFFRRIGWRQWAGCGALLAAAAAYFYLATRDVRFAGMLLLVVASFELLYLLGLDSLRQLGAGARQNLLGFGLLMLIVLPWHIFMIARHGWPFVREAVIYHHFDRAAGTIGKPEGTFDVYVKQIGFALFPWFSLLPAAVIRFLRWNASDLDGAGRRNLWVFLAAAVPYAAFSLFQTKFHHYIFPAVPFLAVMIGVFLSRMVDEDDRAWMRLLTMLSLPVGAVLLIDVLHDYQWFVHLFDYYYGYPLPPQLNPYPFFAVAGGLWLLLLAWLFFRRRIGRAAFTGMVVVAGSLCVFLTAWILPRVTRTFTQEPLYRAYMKEAGGKAPIAHFNGWLERSVSFYFDNRAADLSQADQPNVDKAIEFLRRPERSFLILGAGYGRDCKALLADLRPHVQRRLNRSLYVVFDQHPFSCLVSTERDPEGERRVQESLLRELPAGAHPMDVDFEGKIRLVGYQLEPEEVPRGESFRISYFFRCTAPVNDDWLVFIHGDGPQGGAHRVFGDHAPLGGLYPTSEWKVGDLVRDEYEMSVPANYPYEGFTLWMGFWKGNIRLPVSQKYAHDGDNRVRSAYVRVR